jgi:hypothetical protein
MTDARRSDDSKCAICGRASIGELCRYHEEGTKRLIKHYEVWKARTGASWEDYLRSVSTNELAGDWVRESAGHLLEKGVIGQRDPIA